jgi:hypothetical protein
LGHTLLPIAIGAINPLPYYDLKTYAKIASVVMRRNTMLLPSQTTGQQALIRTATAVTHKQEKTGQTLARGQLTAFSQSMVDMHK